MFGIESPFADRQEVRSFKIFGNKINLLGADSESVVHGVSCDYFYINEALDVSHGIFDQSEMRCRKFWWMDFNPKFTDHWVYDNVQPRPDVALLKTTFLDNPGISREERNKILSYEPTEENKQRGTANAYMWDVYGLGIAAAPEGLIFPYVTWIDKFPEGVERVYYGLDFGYSISPSALSKVGVVGDKLFAECLLYAPTPSSNELIPVLREKCGNAIIWADSADPGMISQLRAAGLNAFAVNKYQGSILAGISSMKKYKIHLVDHPAARKEQMNYKHKEINGIRLNEPEDGNNHFWDAFRMAVLSNRI
jgi:phage terminase large subunit